MSWASDDVPCCCLVSDFVYYFSRRFILSVWSFIPDWALVCVEEHVEPIIDEGLWDF